MGEFDSSWEIRECFMEEVTLRMRTIGQDEERKFRAEGTA